MIRNKSRPGTWRNNTIPKNLRLGYKTGCNTVTFNVSGTHYENICGQAKAYQKGTTGAFYNKIQSIKGAYVDGISIALASPRTHIWTCAAGYSTDFSHNSHEHAHNCPCTFHPGVGPPAFVGNDNYCDSGSRWASHKDAYYIHNPLWDGNECYSSSGSGCCALNG